MIEEILKMRLEKARQIEALFNKVAKDYDFTIDPYKFTNQNWLNRGYKIEKIEKEIRAIYYKKQESYNTISTIFGNDTQKINIARNRYDECDDLSASITYTQSIFKEE